MKSRILLTVAGLLAILLTACGPSANKKLVINVGGPCETCPIERLDSILKNFDGYVAHTFDAKTGDLTIDLDSSLTSPRQLAETLTDYGYEVSSKEFSILLPTEKVKDACCTAQQLDVDFDDEGEETLNEMQQETDELSTDNDLDNMDLDKVSSKETRKENLIEESDLNVGDDDDVSEASFSSGKKKK
jgi:hypothetical protein